MEASSKKVAYVTGGSRGIGFGIAQKLVEDGYCVTISGRNPDTVNAAAAKLDKGNRTTLGLVSDVSEQASEQDAVRQILDRFGRLDVVIANAGVGHFAPIDQLTAEQWAETINTNLTGVFHTVKASVDALKRSEGYLITIASLAGTNFFENGAAYNASKFGLVGFTQAVMLDLRKFGVKVTTIMPGSVATEFNQHAVNDADAWKIQPEDIGQLVIDLLQMHPRTLPSKVEVRPSRPK
jgi:3-oxoacyl-[acyl-carrier protein] reductase